MNLIVDIQFFKDAKNALVPKEVAVVGLEDELVAHWVTRPTSSLRSLPQSARKQNNYLTEHHHGIDFYDGDTSVKYLCKSLRYLAKTAKKIYVRGNQKYEFLNGVIAREIINLENYENCPSFSKLPRMETLCWLHGTKSATFVCALNNVYRLKEWFEIEADKQDE